MPLRIEVTDIDNLTKLERDVLAVFAGVPMAEVGKPAVGKMLSFSATPTEPPLPVIAQELADLEEGQAADLQEANERANASTPAQAAQVFSETTAVGAQVPPVDKTGLPWDERIHSSSRALNSDGTWRVRRGADKDRVALIEAQLRSGIAPVPQAPATPAPQAHTVPSGFDRLAALGESPVPIVEDTPSVPPVPQAPAAPAVPPVPQAPAAPAVPPPSAATPAPAVDPTADVMRRCSDAVISRKVTPDQITAVCQSVGLERIAGIVTNKAKAPELSAALLAQLGI